MSGQRRILKWVGIVLGGLIGLALIVFVVLYGVGTARANRTYDIPVETVAIPSDAAALQRGKHLATINMCTRCHTETLGGQLEFDIPGMLTIPTPNLTSGAGGIGRVYSDADWVRAIRHGVNHEGKALFGLMSSQTFYYLSDQDLGAIIAFAKSVPPVDNELPARRIEPLGRVLMATGMLPPSPVDQINHSAPRPAAPERGVTAAYGGYLARLCTECHGANLNGAPFGPPGQEVPSPNLTRGGELSAWDEASFMKTMRTGVTPIGRPISEEMPWRSFGQMTDDELKALWLYLQSLPALEQGG